VGNKSLLKILQGFKVVDHGGTYGVFHKKNHPVVIELCLGTLSFFIQNTRFQ